MRTPYLEWLPPLVERLAIDRLRPLRVRIVVTLMLCLLGSDSVLAQQAVDRIDTGFQPSRDLPAVQNRKGSAFAVNGQCNGIDELALAYWRWRKQNPGSPDLAAVTAAILTKTDYAYVEKTMDMATAKSFANGVTRSEPSFAARNPAGFEHKLIQRLQDSREPQSIVLAPDPKQADMIPHRISVYGAEKISTPQGERWEFKVADSNQYGKGDPDKVRLVYTPGTRSAPGYWSETLEGKEVAAWYGGDVIHGGMDKPSDYVTILQRAQQGDKLGDIRRDLKIPEHPLDRMPPLSAVKDPKAGGVLLRFDPSLFLEAPPEAELKQFEEKYRAFLAQEGTEAAVFRLHADPLTLRVVPLKSLLAPGAQTVGALTRVRGYVRSASGEISLVGLVEAGKSPIPLDALVVALRAVYSGPGASPYISLDPDPLHPLGAQRVRIGGIPAELRSTAFVQTLIRADYLMKRIALGRVQPKVAGFKRWTDILAEGDYGRKSRSRLWLSPLAAPVSDVLVTHRGTEEAVLFESHVQVQAEEMVDVGAHLAGTGSTTRDTDLAADQYTQHFDALAQEFPEFAALEQVFDLCKLATALRAFRVHSADITALAARKPAVVAIAPTYPGIGPETVAGRTIKIYGGATTECALYRKAAVTTDCLLSLLDAAGKAETVQVILPEEMDLGAGPAIALRIDSDIAAARGSLFLGDCNDVIERTSEVLEVVPDHREARTLRADAYTLLNRLPEACADYEALAAADPEASLRHAILRARMDDRAGALKDIAAAQKLAPENQRVRYLTILAYIELVDIANATHALDAFSVLSPLDPRIPGLKARLTDIRLRTTPEEARRYLRLNATLPPRIAMEFALAQTDPDLAYLDIPNMMDVLAQAEGEEIPIAPELEIPYRARISLLYGFAALGSHNPDLREKARIAGDEVYRHLVRLYPDRALPSLVRAKMAATLGESPQTVADYLRTASTLSWKNDPFYPQLRELVGTDRITDALAMECWTQISRPDARAEELLALVRERSSAPEAALIQALEEETRMDLPGYLRNGTANLDNPDAQTSRKNLVELVHLTRLVPANLPANSPLLPLISRLYLHVSLLKLELGDSNGFQENTFRGILALQHARPALSRNDSPGKSLGILLMIYSVFEFREAVKSEQERERKIDAGDTRLKGLTGAHPAPMARFLAEMAKQTALIAATYQHIGAHYRESSSRLQSHTGELAGVLSEILPALVQEAFLEEGSDPRPELTKIYPKLAQSKEYQASRNLALAALSHSFTPRPSEALYTHALALCKSRSDFEAMAAFLEALREANHHVRLFRASPATEAKLIRWEEEARFRSE